MTLDPSAGFTAATGRFTVPYTGYYRIDAFLNLVGITGTANLTILLRKNGSNVLQTLNFTVTNASPNDAPIFISYVDQATLITDYYELLIQSTGAFGLNVATDSSLSIQRIQA